MAKSQYQKNLEAGMVLVSATDQLDDMIQQNYTNGSVIQQALAILSAAQIDLCASFVILQPNRGPIISRSVILRTVLENHGIMLHIIGNKKRAKSYLDNFVKVRVNEADSNGKGWTTSSITSRVSKIDENALLVYDVLSNFIHGNNITSLISPDQQEWGYEPLMEDFFVSEFVQLLYIMVHELMMSDETKELLYEAMEKASRIALDGREIPTTEDR